MHSPRSRILSLIFSLSLAPMISACGDDAVEEELPPPVELCAERDGAPPEAPNPWGPDGFVGDDPIVVDEGDLDSWQFVPIEGMVCGDGTPLGIFVNYTAASRELLFFLGGGGICYDDTSCALMPDTLVGPGDSPSTGGRNVGVFDRSDPTNPFREASYVFVPHCTGDFHLGDRVNEYVMNGEVTQVHQRGRANLMAALRRVVPGFADATRVTAAGFSAGGVGVTGSFHTIAQAFLAVGAPLPYLINDSGPLLRDPFLATAGQAEIAEAWELSESLFAWCPRCETHGFHEVFSRLHEIYPSLRSSLICTYDDAIVKGLYMLISGGGLLRPGRLEEGLVNFSEFTAACMEDSAEGGAQRELLYEGTRHGGLVVAPLSETPGLADFLEAQVSRDETWSTLHF